MSYSDLADLVTFRPLERSVGRGPTRYSPFRASWSNTVSLLAKELRAHGARKTILEVDLREQDLRLDGLPRAESQARSPGIVLSFEATAVPNKPHLRYEVAEFRRWQDNVRAVALGLETLRAVDRYGMTRRGEQYAGWRQLEADSKPSHGRELLRKHGGEKGALFATHPDHGGSARDFDDVRAAIAQ